MERGAGGYRMGVGGGWLWGDVAWPPQRQASSLMLELEALSCQALFPIHHPPPPTALRIATA